MVKERFKIVTLDDGRTYKFHNMLFIFAAIISLLIGIAAIIDYTRMDYHYYMHCDEVKCFNEYYNSPSCGKQLPADRPVCTQEFFNKGDWDGSKPSLIGEYGSSAVIIIILGAFIINHFAYNKGFKIIGGEDG